MRRRAGLLLLGLAALLTGVGIALGDPGSVWVRAAQICLECVGIG